jgi:uncharacterized protein
MFSEALLSLIVCPETKQTLSLLDSNDIDEINRKIRAGELNSRNGQSITNEMSAALVRADGRVAYPVRDDIPILLIEESFKI